MWNPDKFPEYTAFNPLVPIRCITPDVPGCLHRFFDTSPISPSGRYLAVFQFPREDRIPEPGEAGQVRVIDLQTGENRVVASTCGWDTQLGANINWGGSDEELYFNDVDTATWQPFAWKWNPLTGAHQRLEGTVYHASPDGRWLISSDLTTLRRIQVGYGVAVPQETIPCQRGLSKTAGFHITDTTTGKRRLLVSLHDLVTRATPNVAVDNPETCEVYGFHSKFNPQGDRLMMSVRWYPAPEQPGWNMFKANFKAVRFAWVTMKLDGSEMRMAVGPEQWEKGGHHATWFPDGNKISMNLNIDRNALRLVQVNADGTGLRKMLDNTLGSGHPTVYPGERHLLTDTYTNEPMVYGDGTTPLRWIDLKTGEEKAIARIPTDQPCADTAMRVDPHPAWDRTWRYVTFNAYVGGTRRVFIADMQKLV